MKIVVFGGGMQGRVIAQDLAARKDAPEVVLADVRAPGAALPPGVRHERVDALDADQVKKAVGGASAAVLALPGEIARAALANLVKTGAPVVDVSFIPDPPLDLDHAARQSGTCAIVDCGVAPGLSHMLVARAHRDLDGLDGARVLVGGLPQQAPPVFRHAVYFNPRDLVAEYIRPARWRRLGKDEAPLPLDAPVEQVRDNELGGLEAFLSDGLRTLLQSYRDVPTMEERTLRWPGHVDYMRALRDTGFLGESTLAGAPESPADATARTLGATFPGDAHPDVLLMRVEGRKGGRRRAWRLLDKRADGVSAMSRTTGFTTAAVAMLLAKGKYKEPGVHPPERIGREAGLAREVLGDLEARGVRVMDL